MLWTVVLNNQALESFYNTDSADVILRGLIERYDSSVIIVSEDGEALQGRTDSEGFYVEYVDVPELEEGNDMPENPSLTVLERIGLLQVEKACQSFSGTAWSECIGDYGSLSGKQLSGIVSSLAAKGLVSCENWSPDPSEHTVTVTLAGKEALG